MKKMGKKSINYGLKILTILAFVLIFMPFNRVSAQCGEGGCNYIFSTKPIVYSNETNQNVVTAVANVAKPKVTEAVAKVTTCPVASQASSLTATAIYGTNSFLPSGLIQWIFFAIFINHFVNLSFIKLLSQQVDRMNGVIDVVFGLDFHIGRRNPARGMGAGATRWAALLGEPPAGVSPHL